MLQPPIRPGELLQHIAINRKKLLRLQNLDASNLPRDHRFMKVGKLQLQVKNRPIGKPPRLWPWECTWTPHIAHEIQTDATAAAVTWMHQQPTNPNLDQSIRTAKSHPLGNKEEILPHRTECNCNICEDRNAGSVQPGCGRKVPHVNRVVDEDKKTKTDSQ